jgi:hypothetical protein
MKKYSFLIIVLTATFLGCSKEDFLWDLPRENALDGQINDVNGSQVPNKDAPIVNTGSDGNTSESTSSVSGDITSVGSSEISSYGHCWSVNQMPTINDAITNLGSINSTGVFSSSLTNLSPNTTYYVRAYATNSFGTSYGSQISFSTNISLNLASISTSSVTAIAQTSATTGGNITNDGGSSVTSSGVCYSTSQGPTTSNSIVNTGNGLGSFIANLSNLSPNTTYYLRAFAINSVGTSYGNQISFSTSQLPNITCSNTAITSGTDYSIQTSSQSYFTQGSSYSITMFSSIYSFGQANSVELYDSDVSIYSFGSFLNFSNNTKTFTLPSSIPVSNCYNIRVVKGSDLYVSEYFTILP